MGGGSESASGFRKALVGEKAEPLSLLVSQSPFCSPSPPPRPLKGICDVSQEIQTRESLQRREALSVVVRGTESLLPTTDYRGTNARRFSSLLPLVGRD